MTKRLLLISATTGYQARMFAEAAGRLDYKLTLATDRCHVLDDPWGDHAIALRFEDPEGAPELVAQALAKAGVAFDGIVAVGDRPAYLAALIASRFGLAYHPPASVKACGNKFLARERFRAAGLPVPQFNRISLAANPAEAALTAPYPCVLKPLGLSGSRGVIRANDPVEFVAAFERIRALIDSPEILRTQPEQAHDLQVETFIEGKEFSIEGLVTNGHLQVLAIFDKPDPLDGPFFEESIYVTPSRESEAGQSQMMEMTARAVRALGLTHGPVHAEMRVNQHGVWMLEVAARPIGGLCAKALQFEKTTSLEELILRHAAGEDVSGSRLMGGAAGVMMVPIPGQGVYQGVQGIELANAIPGVEVIVTAKRGQKMIPLPEGASYLGFIFARGENPSLVERSLRAAHHQLAFEITVALPVLALSGGRGSAAKPVL